MNFKDVLKRITGITTPIFGISWNPPKSERDIARRVIVFLEDRRILYTPTHMEHIDLCIKSALTIREFLTETLFRIDDDSDLNKSLWAMRSACRRFLDIIGVTDEQLRIIEANQFHEPSPLRPIYPRPSCDKWILIYALGELRGVYGIHVAKLSAMYGLDINGPLSTILPAMDKGD